VPLDVEVQRSPTFALVRLGGELDLSTSAELQSTLSEFDRGGGPVVIDLTDVTFLDSSTLRVLVQLRLRLADHDGRAELRLAISRPAIRRVFDVSGLAESFDLFESVEDATRGL
jgi:anti-sigma B factor antagonist